MYPEWPNSLPEPRQNDYQVTGALPVERSQMESGRSRVYRVTSTIMRNISASIVLTKSQASDFWVFFNNDANAGADFVSIPVLTGNVVSSHLCRFISYPSMKKNGALFEISFSLETDEQSLG